MFSIEYYVDCGKNGVKRQKSVRGICNRNKKIIRSKNKRPKIECEHKCREVINWLTVNAGGPTIFPETSRTERSENDNIRWSTFSLIGQRALQICICHKHNETAFHIRNRFFFSLSLSFFYSFTFFSWFNIAFVRSHTYSNFQLKWTKSAIFSVMIGYGLFMRIDKLMICHRIAYWWQWWSSPQLAHGRRAQCTQHQPHMHTCTHTHTHLCIGSIEQVNGFKTVLFIEYSRVM